MLFAGGVVTCTTGAANTSHFFAGFRVNGGALFFKRVIFFEKHFYGNGGKTDSDQKNAEE